MHTQDIRENIAKLITWIQIKQFLKDVDWGDLDCLVIDTPPGTSDEHLSIVQYLKDAGIDGAVIRMYLS